MHEEWFSLSRETAEHLNTAKSKGKRILAVGTTTARVLESCVQQGRLMPRVGSTRLFITPGYSFQMVDALLTNFHLPKSTLLMLVSAFAGLDFVKEAYQAAIRERYRFFSFGDAMLIV
jgi:S-adenosylmethionine:tRNA ribosyltransferase-isomerase